MFGGFFPQDVMRSISYKYAGVIHQNQDHQYQLLFLERERGRRWMKKQVYLKLINNTFPVS